MHYNEHKTTNEFLDLLASNSYLPYMIQPSQYTSHSRTLIDNIFSNAISKDIISGNITTVLNCFDTDWSSILKLDEENVNSATKNFLDTINSVLNKYAPLKKVNKYKLRLKKETLDYFWHSKITLH